MSRVIQDLRIALHVPRGESDARPNRNGQSIRESEGLTFDKTCCIDFSQLADLKPDLCKESHVKKQDASDASLG